MGAKRMSQEEYREKLKKDNPTIILIGEYITTKQKTMHKCLECGYEWNVTPHSVTGKKVSGCPKCFAKRLSDRMQGVPQPREKKEYEIICQFCGEKHKSTHKERKFCSIKCANRNKGKLEKDKRVHYICKHCNKQFFRHKREGRDNCFYCSKECFNEANRQRLKLIASKCRTCGDTIPEGRKKYCSDKCNPIFTLKKCVWCGEDFYTSKQTKQNCSKECSHSAFKSKKRERDRLNYKTEEKTCKYCGEKFMTQFKKSKTFCSDECKRKKKNQRKYNDREKQLMKNGTFDETVTLPKLVKKDKFQCKICGEKVEYQDVKINHEGHRIFGDWYPSIDHIIPVSKGGTHTWENVQLAHRICNSLKCDKV